MKKLEHEEMMLGRIIIAYERPWGSTNTLHFTNNRIIVERVASAAKVGGAIIAGGAVGFKIAERRSKKKTEEMIQETVTPDQILNSHEKNYAINYEDIQKVTLKRKTVYYGTSFLTIESKNKKSVFTFPRKHNDHVPTLLPKIFSDKLEIK